MAQALDPAAYVHEGFWTDWTKAYTQRLTLTLCPTSATFLTNSLALFVALSGGQLWTILRFTLHQLKTPPRQPEVAMLHNQRQIVLRNAATDLATARLLWIAAWRARDRTERPSARYILIGLFAIFHSILFMAAGTFSNRLIMSAGSKTAPSMVLSRSYHCGVWNPIYFDTVGSNFPNATNAETIGLSVQYLAKWNHNIQLSFEYARECYMEQPSYYMSSACGTLKRSRLDWTNYTSSCPFDTAMCNKDSETIVFDTGSIDSHDDLGINAPPIERMKYRRITTCAVLNDTDHVTDWTNASATNPSQRTAYAYYGPGLDGVNNWTYSYSNFASLYDDFSPQVTVPYQVGAQSAGVDFDPIAPLRPRTGDLFLLFLSFTGQYFQQIDDPWFAAHQVRLADGPPKFKTQYARDRPISTLGCTEQHQFCTTPEQCTPFLGFNDVQHVQSFGSVLTSRQNVTFDRILRAVDASSMYNIVRAMARTTNPMLAMNETAYANTVISLHLPKTQWISELGFWHSIAMAQLQRAVVQWGTGQIAPDPQLYGQTYLLPPQTTSDSWFCENLLIPSTVFQSFSVIAILLIVIFGALVIIISLSVENIGGWIQRRYLNGPGPRQNWDHDDMLRLPSDMGQPVWKPRPPLKDDPCHPVSKKGPPREMLDLTSKSPLLRDLRGSKPDTDGWKRASSQILPPEHLMFPFPVDEKPPRARNPELRNENTPSEGKRDTLVAISLNSYDAVVPEVEARNILASSNNGLTPPATFIPSRPPLAPPVAMVRGCYTEESPWGWI